MNELKEFVKQEIEAWKSYPQRLKKLTAFPYINTSLDIQL